MGQHTDFAHLVQRELERQEKSFPGRKVASMHEAYGVLLEEVDEFWDEVKKKPTKRVPSEVLTELVQISAYCSRIAVELAIMDAAEEDDVL